MLGDKELSRSACRIFGHSWERPRYVAYTYAARSYDRNYDHDEVPGTRLKIRRQRTCSRCGEVEKVER
jgi:hypothetical protein